MLTHYFMVNDDARLRALQLDDWLDVLAAFTADDVDGACKRWIAASSRRPTPADILKLCAESGRTIGRRRPNSPPPNWLEEHGLRPSPEAADMFAREYGFASWTDLMDDGRPLCDIVDKKTGA